MTIEQYYDNLYERSESVSDNTCPECKGNAVTEYCMNCGLHHEECECEESDLLTETCEKCFGWGEV